MAPKCSGGCWSLIVVLHSKRSHFAANQPFPTIPHPSSWMPSKTPGKNWLFWTKNASCESSKTGGRWFKATFSSPSWWSLILWNSFERATYTLNHQGHAAWFISCMYFFLRQCFKMFELNKERLEYLGNMTCFLLDLYKVPKLVDRDHQQKNMNRTDWRKTNQQCHIQMHKRYHPCMVISTYTYHKNH